MVAYTSPNCLPYFECTDSACLNTGTACEHSTVFCDLATLIDAKLSDFTDTIDGSISSFPYAEVAISAVPFTVSSGTSSSVTKTTTWDTVVGDSDNMVDLTVDPNTLYMRRPGIWNARMSFVWRSSTADTNLSLFINFPDGGATFAAITSSSRQWLESVADPGLVTANGLRGVDTVLDQFFLVPSASEDVPVAMSTQYQGFANAAMTLTIAQAWLSLRWVADLP